MRRACMAILGLVLGASSWAALDSGKWGWRAPLEVKPGGGRFAVLSIPPEVLDRSRPDLNDLRVVDENGNLAPHIIEREAETGPPKWYSPKLLNPVCREGVYYRATLDFEAPVKKNLLRVNMSGSNYRRRAQVEGSMEGEDWTLVADNLFLFSIDLPDHFYRVDTLRFPENDFSYLRLTVYAMEDEPEAAIQSVAAALEQVRKEAPVELGVPGFRTSFDEKHKETVVELDLGYGNLPVTGLRLSILSPYFHRPYILEGRNTEKQIVRKQTETGWTEQEREVPWRVLGEGILYRMPGEKGSAENTGMAHAASCRYLRIRFLEGDNPPLAFDPKGAIAWWRQPRMIFDCGAERSYSLLWGRPDAAAPQYDLAQAVPNLSRLELIPASLGQAEAIPHREKQLPWTERHAGLMTALFLLAALALGAFLVRSLMLHAPKR